MMIARFFGLVALVLMTARSIAGEVEIGLAEAPTGRKVMVGRYYSEPCLGGSITLDLKKNGTFVAESHGCTGKSGEALGVWSLSDTRIVLFAQKEKGLIEQLSNTFEVRRDRGRWFLVRADNKSGHRKSLLFEKHQSR